MLKYIGIILIVLCCFFAGYYFSLRLKLRRDFLVSFQDFLSTLETNIRYNSGEIIPLVKSCSPDFISKIFARDNCSTFSSYWTDCIENIPKSYALKKDDYNLLYEFGRMLGTTDIEGQINHINLYKELIKSNLDNSDLELNQKSKLSKLLGLFAGLAVALLLL